MRGACLLIVACLWLAIAAAACTPGAVSVRVNTVSTAHVLATQPYDSGTCTWVVTTANTAMAQRATLVGYNLGINYDRLVFYDGNSVNPSRYIRTITGGSVDTFYVFSSGNNMTISLLVDGIQPKMGNFCISIDAVPKVQHCPIAPVVVNYTIQTYYSEPATYIGQASYLANQTCRWLVPRAPGDATMKFSVDGDKLDLAPGDAIYVYDGPDDSSPPVLIVGAYNGARSVFLLNPVGFVKFVSLSGDKFGRAGFTFAVEGFVVPLHCSGRIVQNVTTTDAASFQEPAILYQGDGYQLNNVCEWEFWSPPGKLLAFTATEIALRPFAAIFYVYDGSSINAPLLQTSNTILGNASLYGNNRYVDTYLSTGNSMLVRFVTLPAWQAADGIAFNVYATPPPVIPAPGSVTHINSGGLFGLPFPNFATVAYPPGLTCSFIIDSPDYYGYDTIYLQTRSLNLNPGDYLNVSWLDSGDQAHYIQTLTTFTAAIDFNFPVGMRGLLTFVSQPGAQGMGSGFTMYMRYFESSPQCSGTVVIPPSSYGAPFGIGQGPSSIFQFYYGPADCRFTLTPDAGQYGFVRILDYKMRPGDYLVVYNGPTTAAPILANITGSPSMQYPYLPRTEYIYGTTVDGTLLARFVATTPGNASSIGFEGEFLNMAGPHTYTSCPGVGSIPMYLNDADVTISSASTSDLSNHARNLNCIWNFSRPDYAGMGFTMLLHDFYMVPGDSITVYDGPSINSPIVFMVTNNGSIAPDGTSCITETYNFGTGFPFRTTSRNMIVRFRTFNRDGSTFQFIISPQDVLAPNEGAYPKGLCNGFTLYNTTGRDTRIPISATANAGVVIQSNMRCSWLIDATALPGLTIEIYQAPVYGDPNNYPPVWSPSTMNFTVYDGPSRASPVMIRTGQTNAVQSTGQKVFVEFNTSAAQQFPTFGFQLVFRLIEPIIPCGGHIEYAMAGTIHLSSYPNYDGFMAFTAPRVCTWTVTGPPGSVMTLLAIVNQMTGNETLSIYDGPSPSSPLLYYLDRVTTCVNNLDPRASTTNFIYAVYTIGAGSRGRGFDITVDNAFPRAPATGLVVLPFRDTSIYYGTADPISRPDGTDNMFHNDERKAFPERANVDRTYVTYITPGSAMYFTLDFIIEDGYVDMFNDNRPIGRWYNGITLSYSELGPFCGNNVTLVAHFGSGTTNFTRIFVNFYASYIDDDAPLPLMCQRPNERPCGGKTTVLGVTQMQALANCTFINWVDFEFNAAYNYPALTAVNTMTFSIYSGSNLNTFLNLPNLATARYISTTSSQTVHPFSLPSLQQCLTLILQNYQTLTVSFPVLKYSYYIMIRDMTVTTQLSLPKLVATYYLLLTTNHLMTDANLDSLEFCNTCSFDGNDVIRNLNLPKLANFDSLNWNGGNAETFSLPSLTSSSFKRGTIGLVYWPNLFTISLGNATGMVEFNLDHSVQVNTIDLSLVSYVYNDIVITATHMTTFSMPSLDLTRIVCLSQAAYMTTLSMPRLRRMDSLSLSDSVITTVTLPQVYRLNSLSLQRNYQLRVLDMCALTQMTGSVNVVTCPDLSCAETITLFSAAGAPTINAMSPNCDPNLLGTFGCARNTTITVAAGGCGYNLACIQTAIDSAYQDKGTLVAIPAGTYTGCAPPLRLRDKVITLSGAAGASGTVIDCQGMGRAFVFAEGQSRRSEIANIIIKNAVNDTGGAILISGGSSPTLRGLTISACHATAAGGGGAVAITDAGSYPLLVDLIVSNCDALSGAGGAVSVSGAAVELRGGIYTANTARQGGGLALVNRAIGAISGTVFTANRADQAGAVYADSGGLRVTGAWFVGNQGGQFGGALAAVPTDTSASGTSLSAVWTNVSDTLFSGNTATTAGALYGFSANLGLRNVSFDNNVARRDGGAVSALCSPSYKILLGLVGTCPFYAVLDDVHVTNNTAGGGGGGVYVKDVRVTTTGGSFRSNMAQGSGGGLYVEATQMTIAGATVQANVAQLSGGGIYCEPFAGTCDITGTTLSDNYAAVAGGAAYLCTVACPNATAVELGLDSAANGVLPDLLGGGNVLAASNGVGVDGYGAGLASDASQLAFLQRPDDKVVSGRPVTQSGALAVIVTDAYANLVTASNAALVMSVKVTAVNGGAVTGVSIGGADTTVAFRGTATFNGVSVQAEDTLLDATYTFSASIAAAPSVRIAQNVYLMPCAPGQGRTQATGPMVCVDCLPGYASSSLTDYTCTICPAGTAATPATNAATCEPCVAATYAQFPGSTVCLPCAEGLSAPAGSAGCYDSAALSTAELSGVIVGAGVGAVLLVVLFSMCLWRLARRKTMQKYYIDSDSTIRNVNSDETPLMNAVREILGATTTSRAGGGQFADVFKGKYEKQWIALKVLRPDMLNNQAAQMEFRREAVALSRLMELKHVGVVELVFFLERNPMCVAMEFCSRGTLKGLLVRENLSVTEKYRLAAETVSALAAVHACNVVHLDIKTENLLLDEGLHIKLADFGIARILDKQRNDSFSSTTSPVIPHFNPVFSSMAQIQSATSAGGGFGGGGGGGGEFGTATGSMDFSMAMAPPSASAAFTPQYVDPMRILESTVQDNDFLFSTDVFSFGIVMWALFQQEEPYPKANPAELIRELKANPMMRPPEVANMPTSYAHIMHRAWHADPSQRPPAAALLAELEGAMRDEFRVPMAPGYGLRYASRAVAERAAAYVIHSGGGKSRASALVGSLNSLPPPPPPAAAAGATAAGVAGAATLDDSASIRPLLHKEGYEETHEGATIGSMPQSSLPSSSIAGSPMTQPRFSQQETVRNEDGTLLAGSPRPENALAQTVKAPGPSRPPRAPR